MLCQELLPPGFSVTSDAAACSAFTRVVACVVAEPPLCHRSASDNVVTSTIRSDCYRLDATFPLGGNIKDVMLLHKGRQVHEHGRFRAQQKRTTSARPGVLVQTAKGIGDNGIWRIAKLNGILYLLGVGSQTTSFSSAFAGIFASN